MSARGYRTPCRQASTVFSVVLACLALSGLGVSAALTTEAETAGDQKTAKLIRKGETALENGQARAALRHFKAAHRRAEGTSVEALLGLARTYPRLSDYESSADSAREALEVAESPEAQIQAYDLLGQALFEQGLATGPKTGTTDADKARRKAMQEEARAAFEEVLEISGGSANEARYRLAEVLTQLHRPEKALTQIEEYLAAESEGTSAPFAVPLRDYLRCAARLGARSLDEAESEIEPPAKLVTPHPSYTESARRARVQGVVMVQAIVDQQGNLVCPRILKGLSPDLNEATLDTFQRWRFQPATHKGEPIAVFYDLTASYSQTHR